MLDGHTDWARRSWRCPVLPSSSAARSCQLARRGLESVRSLLLLTAADVQMASWGTR